MSHTPTRTASQSAVIADHGITRTNPLSELHPDAPITITRRQLIAAFCLQGERLVDPAMLPRKHLANLPRAIKATAVEYTDTLMADLATAAHKLALDQPASSA